MTKRRSQPRAPLTRDELSALRADDFVRLKLSEDEESVLREINREREQERRLRSERLRIEEKPILSDLRELGWEIESVWDFVNSKQKYSTAIDVLLRHLVRPYSDRIREGIARALARPGPETRKAWPVLVEEYRRASSGYGIIAAGDTKEYRLGYKDGLAAALSAIASESETEDLIRLAKDRAQGESRVLLLRAIRKSKSPLAKQAISELATDPQLKTEISSWRAKAGSVERP